MSEQNYSQMIPQDQQQKVYQQSTNNNPQTKKLIDYLDNRLKAEGFIIHPIRGDGNCLYRSLSKMHFNHQKFFKEIKEQMMYIYQSKPPLQYLVDSIKSFHLVEGKTDNQIYQHYLSQINKLGDYGGQLQLIVLSKQLQKAFIIHTYSYNKQQDTFIDVYNSIYYPGFRATQSNTYHLGLYSFQNDTLNHYFYVQPLNVEQMNRRTKYKLIIQRINQLNQPQPVIKTKRIQNIGIQISKKINEEKNKQTGNNINTSSIQSNGLGHVQKCCQKNSCIDLVERKCKKIQITDKNIVLYLKQIWGEDNYQSKYEVISSQNSRNPLLGSRVLNHNQKFLNVQNFLSFCWYSLIKLMLDDCQISTNGWKTIVCNGETLKNVKEISIQYNYIQEVVQGDLLAFDSLKSIDFGLMETLDNFSIKYLTRMQKQNKIEVFFKLPGYK